MEKIITFDMVYCYLSQEKNLSDEQAEDQADKLFKKLKKDRRFKNITQNGEEECFSLNELDIPQLNIDYKNFDYDFNDAIKE